MNKNEMSIRMTRTIEHARRAEKEHGHRFGDSGMPIGEPGNMPSPSLSAAGQYYLACTRHGCGRAIFDDGTGSATDRQCGS